MSKDIAINRALNYSADHSFSDGNMVVGFSDTHVAVAFNSTPGNKNSVLVLERTDAQALFSLLTSGMRKLEWLY